MTNRLTIDLALASDAPPSPGVEVVVILPRAEELRHTGTLGEADYVPGRQILASTDRQTSDSSGLVRFDLIPTGDLLGETPYRVSWPGREPFDLVMPARDTTLYDLENEDAGQ